MIRGIDHLVIAVPDPDAAATELEAALGVAFTAGGRHPGAGTFNRIAWLSDGAYLELIGVDDRAAAARGPIGAAALAILDGSGAGLAAHALVDDELERTVAELRANGSRIGLPIGGSRRRPDGDLVEWVVAFPERIGAEGLPFLIRHVAAGAEWSPEAQRARAAAPHPIGSPVSLVRLDLAAAEPLALAADHAEQLGLAFSSLGGRAVAGIGPHIVRLVPSDELAGVAVTLAASGSGAPRSADLFGIRIAIERLALP
jgi:hypothetical protein